MVNECQHPFVGQRLDLMWAAGERRSLIISGLVPRSDSRHLQE
jgi:hypothetical protein